MMEACDLPHEPKLWGEGCRRLHARKLSISLCTLPAGGSEVLVALLESIWMQFGPFMRRVYEMSETTSIVDKHQMTLEAIRRGDAEALAVAIKADILDAIHLLKQTLGNDTL